MKIKLMLIVLIGTLVPNLASPTIGGFPSSAALPAADAGHQAGGEPLYAVPTLRDRVGRLIAPVFINGQGPFRFLLDTGATNTAITEAAASRLGLTPHATARASVQGVNGNIIVPTVYISELSAGALHLTELQVPLLSEEALQGLDGVLSMDGLGDKRVTADFRNDRVTISRSTGRQPSRSYTVLRGQLLSKRLFMVDARIGRIKIKAVIDTGASHTLGNPALLAELAKHRAFKSKAPIVSVDDATQTLQDGVVHLAPQIAFSGANIRNTDVTFSDFAIFKVWGLENQPAILVGMDVLGVLGEMTIDYRRQELQLLTHEPSLIGRL